MKFSVAMCTYNGEKYIREQLESILNQTRPVDEIVICDDCSDDNTVQIANEVLSRGGGSYRIVVNENNMNYFKNFEKCALLCSGDWIFFCDQDDVWFPDKVEKMFSTIDEETVMVFCDAIITNEKLEPRDGTLNHNGKISVENFLKNAIGGKCHPYGCTMLISRGLLEKCVPFQFSHDTCCSICAPLFGDIKYVDQPLMYYRRNDGATSGNMSTNNWVRRGQTFLKFYKNMINADQERYFCWPSAFVNIYETYLEKFGERLKQVDEAGYTELIKQIAWKKKLMMLIKCGKIKSLELLWKEFFWGDYREKRGNRNLFILDMIYLLCH